MRLTIGGFLLVLVFESLILEICGACEECKTVRGDITLDGNYVYKETNMDVCPTGCLYNKHHDQSEDLYCFYKGGITTTVPCIDDIGKETNITIIENGETYHESFTWENSEAEKKLTIHIPAHGRFQQDTTFFFVSDDMGNFHNLPNNYLFQVGRLCYVSRVPEDVVPEEIGAGLAALATREHVLSDNLPKTFTSVLTTNQSLPLHSLHPHIQRLCRGSTVLQFTQQSMSLKQHQALMAGETVALSQYTNNQENCSLISEVTFVSSGSCMHWINPVTGQDLALHTYFDVVSPIFCCHTPPSADPSCCDSMTGKYPDVYPPAGGSWNSASGDPSIYPHHQVYMCRCDDPDLQPGGQPYRCLNDAVVGTGGGRK